MAVVTVERVVPHRPQQVFDFVVASHFQNHPRWDPDVLEMRQTSPGPVRLGTSAQVVRRQGRGRVEGTATVVEYAPFQRGAWDVSFGPLLLRQSVDLLPEAGGAATRLRLSIETRAKGPMAVLLPLLRSRFRRTMKNSLMAIDALVGQDNP